MSETSEMSNQHFKNPFVYNINQVNKSPLKYVVEDLKLEYEEGKKWLESSKRRVSCIHIDCELYSSCKYLLDALCSPRSHNYLTNGCILVFDKMFDYDGWEDGAWKAWFEWCSENSVCWEFLAIENPFTQSVAIKYNYCVY